MRTIGAAVATLIVTSVIAFSGCGGGSGVDTDSLGIGPPYPNARGGDYNGEKNFAYLLNTYAKSQAERTPWVGFWWPYTANGIASARSGGGSPAGKYDAARGGTRNSQAWEAANHGAGVPGVQGWWGHCNGWCAASALYPEPKKAVTVNGITFDVGDIKALLTEAGMEASADFYGNRVDWGRDFNSPKLADVIPNQFFLVLTNYMGKLRQPVLIDRYTTNQVWNQPVAGYEFQYPKPEDYQGEDPANRGVFRINLTGAIWWGEDGVAPGEITNTFTFQDDRHFTKRTLKMEIWLDGPVVFEGSRLKSSGNVLMVRQGEYLVGGAWKNGGYGSNTHPDYMWVPFSLLKPTTYSNPQLDMDWISKHILSGGVDDPSVTPVPVPTAPSPGPLPSDQPDPGPTGTFTPIPFPTFTPHPTSTPAPTTTPVPVPRPQPQPQPQPEP